MSRSFKPGDLVRWHSQVPEPLGGITYNHVPKESLEGIARRFVRMSDCPEAVFLVVARDDEGRMNRFVYVLPVCGWMLDSWFERVER